MSGPGQDPAVSAACGQLVLLVEGLLSPGASAASRREAFEKLEEFKAQSPIVVQCALALAAPGQHSPYVR